MTKDRKDKKRCQAEQGRPDEAETMEAPEPLGRTLPDDDSMARIITERDDLMERLQRVSADYLNYQKRSQRDVAQAREFANEQLIKSLLPVLDDMERALSAAQANHPEGDPMLSGMQLVHDKTLETLGRFGLEAIEAVGKEFDPDRHSAMMQQPSDDHPPQTVLQELQKGYALKNRTIRPSAVVVSEVPPDEAEASAERARPDDPIT